MKPQLSSQGISKSPSSSEEVCAQLENVQKIRGKAKNSVVIPEGLKKRFLLKNNMNTKFYLNVFYVFLLDGHLMSASSQTCGWV